LWVTKGHPQFASPEVDGCCELQFSVSSGCAAYFVSLSAPGFKQDIQTETSEYSLPQTYSVDYFYGDHPFLDISEYPGFPIFSAGTGLVFQF
jgi:hypothetical protein